MAGEGVSRRQGEGVEEQDTSPLPVTPLLAQWTLCWLAGCLGLSYAWLLLALLLYTRKDSRTTLRTRQVPRDGLLGASSLQAESLPSWVTFPEVDRVEWVNTILEKLWPNMGEVVQSLAKTLLEPLVNKFLNSVNMENTLKFRLKQLSLGRQPPRLEGVRVYERNTARDEIVMDVDVLYRGDASLVFSLQNMKCQFKQLRLRTTVRLVLKPLIACPPFIGGLEVYLLEMPDFSYSFSGLANVADLPGLSQDYVRAAADTAIRSYIIWPNRLTFYLPTEEVLQSRRLPVPQGVLGVSVLRARNLIKADQTLFGGKSDPYVVLSIGSRKVSFVEDYIENSVTPEWHYWADFPLETTQGTSLTLQVFDYDHNKEDDFLGRCTLDLSEVEQVNEEEQEQEQGQKQGQGQGWQEGRWYKLKGVNKGEVEVRLDWRPTSPSPCSPNPCYPDTRYALTLMIDSCTGLTTTKGQGARYCLCEATLEGQGGKQAPTKRSSLKRNIQKTLSLGLASHHSKARPGKNSFRTQLQPSSGCCLHVWQEVGCLLGQHLDTDLLLLEVLGQKGAVFGRVQFPVRELQGMPGLAACTLEKRLEDCSSGGAVVVFTARILYY